MREKLLLLKNEALALILQSRTKAEIEELRITFLGKKGKLNDLLKLIPTLSLEEKKEIGKLVNEVKITIEEAIESQINNLQSTIEVKKIDVTIPGKKPPEGHLHFVTYAISEIEDIFKQIGFTRASYPEIDTDWYAFEALNMPKNHPARDEWETFFIENDKNSGKTLVLTPHTSNGQVREMERLKKPPIRMINISKCYRRQSDVSHSQMFHQFEGLVIDKNISLVNLKGTIDYFVKSFFGEKRKARLRPFHFRFTEPSQEIDVSCSVCNGAGCRLCKAGWLELGGVGMVHPNVLRSGGIDPTIYTGFAFGWGVERTYMMKEGLKLDDIRLIYKNDIRFLNQF